MATFYGYVVGGSLALRSNTSTGSTRLATIPDETALTVSTISGNTEWFATSYAGYTGYVVAEFIGITNDGGACTVTTASGSLNIRKKPSGSVIFTAAQNSTLRLLDYTSVSGWYRVSNGEGTGWADSDYLTITAYPGGGSVNPDPDPDPDIPVDPEVPAVPAPSTILTATMELGDAGSQVIALQERLAELKYYVGVIDGTFGSATDWAVRYFQSRNGLDVDGVVGSGSRAVLNSTSIVRGIDDQVFNWTAGDVPQQMYMNGAYAPWANEPFDADNTSGVETIANAGNCPSAFAMIASTFNRMGITPAHVCKFAKDDDLRDEDGQNGVRSEFFSAAASEYGLTYHNTVSSLSAIQTQLGYGRLALVRIVGSSAHGYCSATGATYLVIYAIENGVVKVLNPNYNTRTQADLSTSAWNSGGWMREAHIYGA